MTSTGQTLRDKLHFKAGTRNPQENAWGSLVGLLLIWGALFLTFEAHRRSESVLRLAGGDSLLAASLKPPVNEAIDPIFKLMLPLELKQLHTSARQMIRNVSVLLGMEMTESSLNLVEDTPRDVDFKSVPAYGVLHRLIDGASGKYGIAVSGNQLSVFEQKISIARESRDQWALQWEADRPVDAKPIAIMPSAESDLWFSVALTGPVEVDASRWNRVRVEIWRGGQQLCVSTAALNDLGRADMQLTSQGSPTFSIVFTLIQNKPETVMRAGDYHMKLQFREMTAKGA